MLKMQWQMVILRQMYENRLGNLGISKEVNKVERVLNAQCPRAK
jgi:hypothetical protein